MFERVYMAPQQVEHQGGAIVIIRDLVDYHLRHPDRLPPSFRENDADLVTQVADYVAGMTDRFAEATHDRLFGSVT
jgi:dGTPase